MPRIKPIDPDAAPPDAAETLKKLPPLNIFRVLAHGDGLLGAFTRMGNYLLFKTKLNPILREIAIIRTGVLSRAKYEVHQHEKIGRDLGMSDALIKAIHVGPHDSVFTELQHLVMRYTDDVVQNVRATDATYEPLVKHMTPREMQELTVTIGYYMMVSRFLETFDVQIEGAGTVGVQFPESQKRKS